MANPAKFTVTRLVANDMVPQPMGDDIDSDGVVPVDAADLDGATGRLLFLVVNTDPLFKPLDVTVESGDNPPAVCESLGPHTERLGPGSAGLFGPYESARFMRGDGSLRVAFATVGGTAASASVRVYLLPKAV